MNVGLSLADKLPKVDKLSHSVSGCTNSFFLDETDKEEILSIDLLGFVFTNLFMLSFFTDSVQGWDWMSKIVVFINWEERTI